MIESAVRTLLTSDTTVSGLVGTRVYVGANLPQGATLPLVVIHMISHVADNHLRGACKLQWERLQIEAWASTMAGADTLLKAIDNALNGKKSGTIKSCNVLAGGSTSYQEPIDAHVLTLDFGIWFER